MRRVRPQWILALLCMIVVAVLAMVSMHFVRSDQVKSDSRAQMQTQLAWTAVEKCIADHGGAWRSEGANGFDCAAPQTLAAMQPAFRDQLQRGAQPGGLFPYATEDTIMLASISDVGSVPIWYVKLQTKNPRSSLVRLIMRKQHVTVGATYNVCITRMFSGTSPDEKAALESACPGGTW